MKIYFDTEFSSLWDPQLISVGMAAEDGTTLYVELNREFHRDSQFTREVVAPLLDRDPQPRPIARNRIKRFLVDHGGTTGAPPELVCDFIGDWWLLLELVPDLPMLAIPRCARGANVTEKCKELGLTQHHALNDAKALLALNPVLQDA